MTLCKPLLQADCRQLACQLTIDNCRSPMTIMIYKGACAGVSQAECGTKTVIKFWNQLLLGCMPELFSQKSHVKSNAFITFEFLTLAQFNSMLLNQIEF